MSEQIQCEDLSFVTMIRLPFLIAAADHESHVHSQDMLQFLTRQTVLKMKNPPDNFHEALSEKKSPYQIWWTFNRLFVR